MQESEGILIVKWEIPQCVILSRTDGKIVKTEFATKDEATQWCKENKVTIVELIGKGWNERDALSSL